MAENKLSFDNLTANMHEKLRAFNSKGVVINNDTIHGDILKQKLHSSLYKGAIYWTIFEAGGNKVIFPGNWLTFSVKDLSDYVISKQIYPTA